MRVLILFLFLHLFSFSQYENYTWPIGAKDLVTFDTLSKMPTDNQRIANPDYTLEGVAVANDPKTGKLLFYQDGHQVFTKNSVVMQGGTDIGGKIQGSTGQGAAIYSIPDCTNKRFIVFSNDADHSVVPFKNGKLYFSIVDMSNGTGVVTQAKTLIRSDLDEGMIVVNDYALGKSWLVAKLMNENKFVSIPLSAVTTDLGNTNNHVISTFSTANGRELKSIYTLSYNPKRKLIAMSGFLPAATVSTIQFNPSTGVLSNFSYVDEQALNNQGNAQQSMIADVCWSPDGSKLYALTQKNLCLYQYDFNNSKSRTLLISDPQSIDNGGMKIDPSGKIWVINNTLPVNPTAPASSFYISRIHNPNAAGGACNLIMNDFFLFSNGYFYFPQHTEYDPTPIKADLSLSGNQTICENDTLQLSALNGVSWLWSNGESTATIEISSAGSYSCFVTLMNGCTVNSETINVSVLSTPTVDAGLDQTVSCGQKVDLKATTVGNNALQWQGNNMAGPDYFQVGQGMYTVLATSVDGCRSVDSVQVMETNNSLNIQLNGGLICLGDSIFLNPKVTGGSGNLSYLWNNGSTTSTIQVAPKSNMNYNLIVQDNTTQCTDSKSVLVEVDSIVVQLNQSVDVAICEGDSVQISTTFNSNYTYNWNFGSPDQSSVSVKNEGQYFVTVSNGFCTSNSDTLIVGFKPTPFADFYVNEFNEAQLNEEIFFTNESTFPFGSSLLWSMGNGATSKETNPSTIYTNPGSYFVQLTIVGPNGCQSNRGQIVDVHRGVEDVTVFVPTAFTPNGDGLNDVLKVQGIHIRSVDLLIHDRWGKLLFYSPNQLVGWDGTDFDGTEMPTGMYVASFIVKGDDEKIRKFGQTVFLQRE
ncbi:MAG: gliding motility-associated C-terminal domain-containing protein [Bacteroidetes bacterium]|nr:gliding motility-associated C-terminal domain-containing protein [Bacteroidota bacterium]